MTLTVLEIAEIASEVLQKTTLSTEVIIKAVIEIMDILHHDPDVDIERAQSRDLQQSAFVFQVVTSLKNHHQQ